MRILRNSKFLFLGILAVSFIIFFSGCSGQEGGVSSAPKTTITGWHWMTDREDAFDELARRYEEKTGVRV